VTTSRQLTSQSLTVVAVICGCFGLYGWAVFISTFGQDGAIGPHHNGAAGADWMAFYAAARAYFEGNLPLIFEGHRFTEYQNHLFADWLSAPLPFHPWLYPPHYLLLVLPFALLPFGLSYAAFMVVTFAAVVAALWFYVGRGHQRWLQVISLAICPAASLNVIAGQNAFLTGALFIGGFGLLARQPVLAGVLLGLLTFKPSLWLMVPVALIAARQWRALGSATLTAFLLVLASLAVFGIEAWRSWLEQAFTPSSDFLHSWLLAGRLWGQSIYASAWVLGASYGGANAAQATATLLAAITVYWSFRRRLPADLQLVILLAATTLAAPHVSGYDTLLLAIAATLFFSRALEADLPLHHVVPMLAAWLCPIFNPPIARAVGLTTPLFIGLMIASAISCGIFADKHRVDENGAAAITAIPRRIDHALIAVLFAVMTGAAALMSMNASNNYHDIIAAVLSSGP